MTQRHFSYGKDDLVVIDWNAAFVYEPSGSRDIPDILEIANAQLLELRYYDDALDHSLARVNQRLKRERRRLGLIFRSPYPALSRQVLVTLLEMSELVERVENSLKIIGDFYLARVYEAAVEQLRIPAWKETVDPETGDPQQRLRLAQRRGGHRSFADPRGDDRPAHRPRAPGGRKLGDPPLRAVRSRRPAPPGRCRPPRRRHRPPGRRDRSPREPTAQPPYRTSRGWRRARPASTGPG